MDKKKFANLPIKADGAHNIELEIEYVDPHYTLEMSPVSPASETGLIRLFRLIPDNPSRPGFAARWDDRRQTIDVDPDPLGCIERDTWRGEKAGYCGHHPTRASEAPRAYAINLHTPDGPVFKARARLNLNIAARLEDLMVTTDFAAAAVIKSSQSE